MKQDPVPDAKCRDKFLVQSVIISGDLEFSNVQTIVRYRTATAVPRLGHAADITSNYSGTRWTSLRSRRRK